MTPMNAQLPMEIALKYAPTPLEATNAIVALGTSLKWITGPAMKPMSVLTKMETVLKSVRIPMEHICARVALDIC